MTKELIIQKMQNLIYSPSISTMEKTSETFEKANYSQNAIFGFELSNNNITNLPKIYSFQLDNIQDALEIREFLTKEKTPNKDQVLKQIIKQFNIDLELDVYIILKIL